MTEEPKVAETIHRCPIGESGFMPCCSRTPFEVSRWDRMTLDDALVTCGPVTWESPPAEATGA